MPQITGIIVAKNGHQVFWMFLKSLKIVIDSKKINKFKVKYSKTFSRALSTIFCFLTKVIIIDRSNKCRKIPTFVDFSLS